MAPSALQDRFIFYKTIVMRLCLVGPHMLRNSYHANKSYTSVYLTFVGNFFTELGLRLNRQFDIETDRKLTFTDNKFAFQSKTTAELLRASLCFNLFSFKYVSYPHGCKNILPTGVMLFCSSLKTTRRSWAPCRKFSARRLFMH